MALKITTLKEFNKAKSILAAPLRNLQCLGIDLTTSNSVFDYKLNWQDYDSIAQAVFDLDFFNQLNQSEEIALALAVTQEHRNDYLLQCEIDSINTFFELEIDQTLISKMGGQFI